MDRLSRIPIFVSVARHGSFVRAARSSGMTGSAISKQIQRLESDLGVRLFHRTTRRLSLTDEGAFLFRQSLPLVEGLEDLSEKLNERSDRPEGLLKVSAPIALANKVLKQILVDFAKVYPEVQLHIELSDRLVDLVGEGFDIAIRIGNLKDSSMVARRLADIPFVTVCSARFLEGKKINIPYDLSKHSFIHYVSDAIKQRLIFLDATGEKLSVNTLGRLSTNNDQMLIAFSTSDLGFINLPRFMVSDFIKTGELVEVLKEFSVFPARQLYAVFPNSRQLPLKTRVMIDFLVKNVEAKLK